MSFLWAVSCGCRHDVMKSELLELQYGAVAQLYWALRNPILLCPIL